MQCPAPNALGQYRGRVTTPDDLDILVTAKNHDVKQAVALGCGLDDWIFALIDLQTMAGFLGKGNYGVARMNGGFSARPCLGLAPADGGQGAHLFHDLQRMLAGRASLLDSHPEYFDPEHGVTLLWLELWDGTTALDLRNLDPYFVEICPPHTVAREGWNNRGLDRGLDGGHASPRRMRMATWGTSGFQSARRTPRRCRCQAWVFGTIASPKLILDRDSFALPPAMRVVLDVDRALPGGRSRRRRRPGKD